MTKLWLVPRSCVVPRYYFLAFFSNKTLWDFSEMLTLVGDVCMRFGYAIITTCRFYRLRIVWDKGNANNKAVNHLGVRKTGANSNNRSLADWLGVPRNAYLVATITLWVLLIASTGAVTFLRIVEYIHRETRAKRIPVPIVDDGRQIERTVSGVAFSFAFFGNVAADYLFYLVVVRGIKGEVTTRDKFKALLPYLPVMIFQAMYLFYW
ncbi:hypothetical protein BCR44DRAFT_1245748 [Catenaria anguillulae PL171]|uniref:Uncharacterized protein n=1 Tax=Catenaria anguillulae PL171 TaxID=765915 RepID=A0A1Y2HXV2_9FUNG|nr:hypothetical protein BCR44DRAFT_1245748 [Catenaria anguillulae PL171]